MQTVKPDVSIFVMFKAVYEEFGAYKGANGKVGVVGGCLEYTGAPYYAAQASLRTVRFT
jgi:ATP-dependent NAD(P)H-hydrate dehydratase